MSSSKIVLVTGANQGLGYYIVQVTALREPTYTLVLCSRDLERGKEALQKLRNAGVTAQVDVLQLDVTNDEQIAAAVKYVEDTYGRLDVLVNNAGILRHPPGDGDLVGIRAAYNEIININLTSTAVVTIAFKALLHKSADPRVINISSGLGSMTNALTRKIGRAVPYGSSKVGLNGLTVHMQVEENDRTDSERDAPSGKPRIRFYVTSPGLLKTAFSNFWDKGKEPELGAEVIYRLAVDDKKTYYEGGTYWEFEGGQMREVPW